MLVTIFLLAIWVDPEPPSPSVRIGYAALSIYLAWSLALMAVAWRNWWLDFRLAQLTHAIDLVAFVFTVYFTETDNVDFSSPFIGFAVFLLISANLRWGMKGVARTALALCLLNGLVGLCLWRMNFDVEMIRLGRRLSYLLVLSVIMAWLSPDLRSQPVVRLPDLGGVPGERREALVAAALRLARDLFGATGAAMALSRGEEPWTELVRDVGGMFSRDRAGPAFLAQGTDSDNSGPVLFASRHNRRIFRRDSRRLTPVTGPFSYPLPEACAVDEGLLVGFTTAEGAGQLLVWGIEAMSVDDLVLAESIGREIGLAIDHDEMAWLARSAAVSGVRHALARDLHDSVAQFLAGTLFRLEALRRWIRDGNDPDPEIGAMKEALRREQAHLRVTIDHLRRGIDGDRQVDLTEEMRTLLDEMGHHWQIATRFTAATAPLQVSISLAHELRQLVREAVANAARHGQCSSVELAVGADVAGLVRLHIRDDGSGFPSLEDPFKPRSISERVEALGGQLEIASTSRGASLEIAVPIRMNA